jgi:DNA-binding XRE family transcriptional regulator
MTRSLDQFTPSEAKALRRRLGLTQEQLARMVGVNVRAIGALENGDRRVSPWVIARVTRRLRAYERQEKRR